MVYWWQYYEGRTTRLVTKEVKFSLIVISMSITLVSVMIVFGSIDFFENMSCEELDKFMSKEVTEGKYPFGTAFTPTQINNLKEQYNTQCF